MFTSERPRACVESRSQTVSSGSKYKSLSEDLKPQQSLLKSREL